MNYQIDEHTHRFGVWTSARAASRSLLSNKEVENIFIEISLRSKVNELRNCEDLTHESYCVWLTDNCNALISSVNKSSCKDIKKNRITFGLAAKIISIYIKTVEVIPTNGQSKLSKVAFPPIDSILLKNFNKINFLSLDTKWSKFSQQQYYQVIQELMKLHIGKSMWEIEVYWRN